MRNSFHDTETFSPVPIKNGTWAYAEKAEIMLWAYALEDGEIRVWDRMNGTVNWQDDLSGLWESAPCVDLPEDLEQMVLDPDTLIWFHNGQMFDFPVMKHSMPEVEDRIPETRRRDTMVQAYCHGLPGALDKLGTALNVSEDKRKSKRGKALVQLFCKPNKDGTRNTKQTHPKEWQEFIEYAGGDITTMREAHRLMPAWNYRGRHLELAHLDAKINARGFAVDRELATAALRATAAERARLATSTQALTDGEVQAATQRDALMKHILTAHGVELPDMRADTLERRLQDENLPDTVKQLIAIRLQASMNSVSKYTALLKGVSSDGRLRGGAQFRGAFRTGRWAHRLFQHGNMPRMDAEAIGRWWGIPANKVKDKHIRKYVESGIASLLEGCEDLTHGEVMRLCSMTVRGVIIAPPGKKLVVADLSNIEGRVAAWLASEEWKLQAFRDYDTIIGADADGEPIRKGPDLYRLAYARAFQIPVEEVTKDQRQIGKVMELMLQYGGGVGAFLTGAATYGIDLEQMAEAAYPSLPADVVEEAARFLAWLYETALEKKRDAAKKRNKADPDFDASTIHLTEAEMLECRLGLTERVFVVCDSLKRMWRRAHPAISSYWGELEDAVKYVINTPGETVVCRKVKVRRDGGWLRIALPSGRALCYPAPQIDKKTGAITYMGLNQYTRQWERISTYGGKALEQCTQATACDQLGDCMLIVEADGYEGVFHVHDELACEVPDTEVFTHERVAELLCSDLGWNAGLPLAAAGFTCYRYRKE